MDRTIDAVTNVHATPGRVHAVLVSEPWRLVADAPSREAITSRCFTTRMRVGLAARLSLEHTVGVTFGHAEPGQHECATRLPVRWTPVGHDRLVPAFDGHLEVISTDGRGTQLRVVGRCRPPLGVLGRLGHAIAGGRVADRSIDDLLHRMGVRLDAEVLRRLDTAPYCAAARPAPLNDTGPAGRLAAPPSTHGR